jgi:hypothetical protein
MMDFETSRCNGVCMFFDGVESLVEEVPSDPATPR